MYNTRMYDEKARVSYLRNFIFGVEDSLVSAVGMMSGIALSGIAGRTILLTGIVYIFVEAFSMAAGTFLSERTGEEYEAQHEASPLRAEAAGAIMFLSYIIAGIIPIAPYAFFDPIKATIISIIGSVAALALLGALGARISKTPILARVFQMSAVGGAAIVLGIVVGNITTAFL